MQVPFFQFACGLTLAIDEAEYRQVDMGMGRRIEVVNN